MKTGANRQFNQSINPSLWHPELVKNNYKGGDNNLPSIDNTNRQMWELYSGKRKIIHMFHSLDMRLNLLNDPGLPLRLFSRATSFINLLCQPLDVPLGVQQEGVVRVVIWGVLQKVLHTLIQNRFTVGKQTPWLHSVGISSEENSPWPEAHIEGSSGRAWSSGHPEPASLCSRAYFALKKTEGSWGKRVMV